MESFFANASAQLESVIVVVLAAALGGVIGVERELADKPVGIRTLMLVAGTSAMLMILGRVLAGLYPEQGNTLGARIDPSRVIQAIVMGIGFICAGTIMRQREREHVEGLTTAATILLAATVGICVALHQLILALSTTALALVILVGLRKVEHWLGESRKSRERQGG